MQDQTVSRLFLFPWLLDRIEIRKMMIPGSGELRPRALELP